VHSSVGASWWERDAPFDFWTDLQPRKGGWPDSPGQADKGRGPGRGKLPKMIALTTQGNEKESPNILLAKATPDRGAT
jgi:hypothetical protein